MTRTVVMPRKVYEVKSLVDDPIRLFLDTGVQRHINPGDVVVLLGETAARVGLDREMVRDRVSFREFNIVMPETDNPKIAESKLFKDALAQYEDVMKHLFSGNVLYLSSNGEISTSPPDAEPPKIDDSEQVEKLEEALSQPNLKVVPNPPEEEEFEEEPEIVLDEDDGGEGVTVGEDVISSGDVKSRKRGRKKSKK